MKYQILATDYDGTLAENGRVDLSTVEAVERLRASGRRAWMVTGREIEDLLRVFPRVDLFDLIVAENGALLYHPQNDAIELLGKAPPAKFTEELKKAGVTPISAGRVIVSTCEPYEALTLRLIKQLGLELEIIFNKGSVMILPTGINKATGMRVALKQSGMLAENVVGVGDAENDHAFLECCGCSVAVHNALDSLKDHADLVTKADAGRGVSELIDFLILTDLRDIQPAARVWATL